MATVRVVFASSKKTSVEAKIDTWKLIKEQEYLPSKSQSILKEEMVTLHGRKLTDTNITSDQDKHRQNGKDGQGAL